jgi:hypothetical protein
MTTKTKTFDCVEMKNRIQAQLMAEYEARRDEFASFMDFVRASGQKSDWLQQMREKFGRQASQPHA